MRKVEGKVSRRFYPHTTIGMSATGSVKNYENAIKSLGGVKVNGSRQLIPLF
jgi:2'-5' RNA ligase